ncbi:hypothetical protein [Caballeronia sp. DA-9]|uniref:hypothetical protein n=1 Tax=Caballeronia sp. DA-9 TaxID=3436237 RepID=UPI003F66237A
MEQQLFVIEFGTSSAKLLVDVGTSRACITGASKEGATYSVLTTSDFSELERWRLFLNREVCPYRCGEMETRGIREMGQSRSPDWI